MAAKAQEFDPQVIAKTLMAVVQDTFRKMCNLELTQDPEFHEKDIIEYNSKMRVFGLEKFDGPCYITSISYFVTQKHLEEHDAAGVLVLYLEEEVAGKILKTLGYANFDENDEAAVLDNCGEFCNMIAGNFKSELSKLGFLDLYLSAPEKGRNDIPQGVDFPFSQYKLHETEFHLWKKKAVVIDVVMAPSAFKN